MIFLEIFSFLIKLILHGISWKEKWFYTEFRGKKLECYPKQIPPKFPHTSETLSE